MIRFDPYPVTINGSRLDEKVRGIAERATEFDDATRIAVIKAANRFDYVPDSSPEARQYETLVRGLLATIVRTEVGRCLFNFWKGGLPVWIIPYDTQNEKVFGRCNANAGHAAVEHTGTAAVRVAFSPEHFTFSSCGWYPGMRPDEVLFHEIVHAYRFASPMVPVLNHDPLRDNGDHEEFLANQVTNVYRSMRGARKFNRDYVSKVLASAGECERILYTEPLFLAALDDFVSRDPFVEAVAKLSTPYNPFRDLGRLKQERDAFLKQGAFHRGAPRPLH